MTSPRVRHVLRFQALALLCTLVLASCRRDGDLWGDLAPYQGEWLLPLVRSEISLQQLSKLQRIRLSTELAPDSLGMEEGSTVDITPLHVPRIGPFPLEVASFLVEVQARIGELEVLIENGFPIDISAGTLVELRNVPDPDLPSALLYSVALPHDLRSGGTYTASLASAHVVVYDTLFVYLKDVRSPGGTNITVEPSSLRISLTIDLRSVDLFRARTNEYFGVRDSFALNIADDLDGRTDLASGHLALYADNGLPVQGDLQLFLYDASGTLLDSLFRSPFPLMGGRTDPSGRTIFTASTSDTLAVNEARMERWRDCRSAVVALQVNTAGYPGTSVEADGEAMLKLQLVGDLRLNIAYTRLE